MGREVKLERIRYLEGIARTLEQGIIAMLVAVVGSRLLFGDPRTAIMAGAVLAAFSTAAGLYSYTLRRRIEAMWAELMREDPRLPAVAPLVLSALVWGALLALLVSWLLGG